MECAALKSQYDVTLAGLSGINEKGVNFIEITGNHLSPLIQFHIRLPRLFRLPFTLLNIFYFKIIGNDPSYSLSDYRKLNRHHYSLIICHHPASLHLAFKLKATSNCKV